MDQDPENFRPAPVVWPPPPTNSPYPETSPFVDLNNFRVQNIWLILFLTVITLGIYALFWLRRQNQAMAILRPDLKLTPLFGNIALAVAFVSAGLDVANLISNAHGLDTASNSLDRGFNILYLVLTFQTRNGFNLLLRAQKGDNRWFSGLWTFLFGVMYLQYKLNKCIQL